MYCLKSYSSIFVVNMIGTIVGTPLIKGRGWNLPEIESLGGVRNFLLERGDKLEKGGGGVDVEMGGGLQLFLLLYS